MNMKGPSSSRKGAVKLACKSLEESRSYIDVTVTPSDYVVPMRCLLHALVLFIFIHPAVAQTGLHVPEMVEYDTRFGAFFEKHGVPGASVAVSKEGRLVYARGFGYANMEQRIPVEPNSRFRIASISKPITAMAILKLMEDGKLDLDEPAFSFFEDIPARGTEPERLSRVTIRHLLQHAGGWSNNDLPCGDVMFCSRTIAQMMGEPGPTEMETIIRLMKGTRIAYEPGTRYSYSNFGYALLGEIVEKVSGMPYEDFVLDMYAEAGVSETRLGRTRYEDRLPNEVRYYYNSGATRNSVFPPHPRVPAPYGGFYLEPVKGAGAWVSTASDILRIIEAVDGRPWRPDVLAPETTAMIPTRPPSQPSGSYYGLGFHINTSGNWWHTGALPGNRGFVIRLATGDINIVTLMNTRFDSDSAFINELSTLMTNIGYLVTEWPEHDLFDVNVSAGDPAIPASTFALDVWPNPVRNQATIAVEADASGPMRLAVYDMLGRTVTVLHDGEMHPGRHTFDLDAGQLPSGMYLIRGTAPDRVVTRTLTVVK